ncbi:hypothetical protein Dimus_034348 [Dionaea muscipula]
MSRPPVGLGRLSTASPSPANQAESQVPSPTPPNPYHGIRYLPLLGLRRRGRHYRRPSMHSRGYPPPTPSSSPSATAPPIQRNSNWALAGGAEEGPAQDPIQGGRGGGLEIEGIVRYLLGIRVGGGVVWLLA